MAGLGSLVEVNPAGPRPDGPVSLISVADLDAVTATASPQLLAGVEEAGSARRVARERDIVFARISPSMENGKVAIVPRLETPLAIVSGELFVLRPKPDVDPGMIWAFLRQQPLLRQLQTFMTGSSGYQRLDREVLEAVELPQTAERGWSAAAAALAQLDRAIVARRATIDTLRRLPALAAAKVAFGLPLAPLGGLNLDLKPGTGERSLDNGLVPILRNPNLLDGSIDTNDLRYLPDGTANPAQNLRDGDLLIVRTSGSAANFARAAVYEGEPAEARFAASLVRIRGKGLSPDFLWAWLQSDEARAACLAEAATASGRYNLTLSALRRLPIPLLDADTQARLGEFAHHTRRMLAVSNRQLGQISATAQALLARQFAGASISPPSTESAPRGASLGIPAGLQPVFRAASASQRRTWRAILRGDGIRFDDLASESERAELQHTLAVLEQLGVLIRERNGVVESWHLPDRETELVG